MVFKSSSCSSAHVQDGATLRNARHNSKRRQGIFARISRKGSTDVAKGICDNGYLPDGREPPPLPPSASIQHSNGGSFSTFRKHCGNIDPVTSLRSSDSVEVVLQDDSKKIPIPCWSSKSTTFEEFERYEIPQSATSAEVAGKASDVVEEIDNKATEPSSYQIKLTPRMLVGLSAFKKKSSAHPETVCYVKIVSPVDIQEDSSATVQSLPINIRVGQGDFRNGHREIDVLWPELSNEGTGCMHFTLPSIRRENKIDIEVGVESNCERITLGTTTLYLDCVETQEEKRDLKIGVHDNKSSGRMKRMFRGGKDSIGLYLDKQAVLTIELDIVRVGLSGTELLSMFFATFSHEQGEEHEVSRDSPTEKASPSHSIFSCCSFVQNSETKSDSILKDDASSDEEMIDESKVNKDDEAAVLGLSKSTFESCDDDTSANGTSKSSRVQNASGSILGCSVFASFLGKTAKLPLKTSTNNESASTVGKKAMIDVPENLKPPHIMVGIQASSLEEETVSIDRVSLLGEVGMCSPCFADQREQGSYDVEDGSDGEETAVHPPSGKLRSTRSTQHVVSVTTSLEQQIKEEQKALTFKDCDEPAVESTNGPGAQPSKTVTDHVQNESDKVPAANTMEVYKDLHPEANVLTGDDVKEDVVQPPSPIVSNGKTLQPTLNLITSQPTILVTNACMQCWGDEDVSDLQPIGELFALVSTDSIATTGSKDHDDLSSIRLITPTSTSLPAPGNKDLGKNSVVSQKVDPVVNNLNISATASSEYHQQTQKPISNAPSQLDDQIYSSSCNDSDGEQESTHAMSAATSLYSEAEQSKASGWFPLFGGFGNGVGSSTSQEFSEEDLSADSCDSGSYSQSTKATTFLKGHCI